MTGKLSEPVCCVVFIQHTGIHRLQRHGYGCWRMLSLLLLLLLVLLLLLL